MVCHFKEYFYVSCCVFEIILAKGFFEILPQKSFIKADILPFSFISLTSHQSGWADAKYVLEAHGLKPISLKPKEGLALINGTQMITSLGAEAVERAEAIVRQADIIAALTLEALKGTTKALDSGELVFCWSHLSYIWVWALLIVHCANFWKWFVVPGVVFLIEKLVGIAVSRMGGLYIVEVNLLPSKVTHLVIKRPPFFHFKPGDYVYINIPAIAKYE
ncbi:histidine ammonia-lyase-like [Cyprinus carpio]|uniref:Histidine ammonia-lyase-like n=1 Tax=Cyprinus carpio TaxID=7962 RepID=A0A9Q9ZS11_CYPCA|nr:histidine ammonia-lyase-like [Cyprinus carpio]